MSQCRVCGSYHTPIPRDREEECGAVSEEFAGLGRLRCELRPGHHGPHREREDGLVWDEPLP